MNKRSLEALGYNFSPTHMGHEKPKTVVYFRGEPCDHFHKEKNALAYADLHHKKRMIESDIWTNKVLDLP